MKNLLTKPKKSWNRNTLI